MRAWRFLPLAAGALALPLLFPPEPARSQEELEPPALIESGTATVRIGPREIPVPYSRTAEGPLVALAPMAAALGGEVEPLAGAGTILRVAETEFLVGPHSDKAVVGQEIRDLSQRPFLGPTGLMVPVDLLERSFGELLGFGFTWRENERRLEVDRIRVRELPVTVDTVHIRGTTTVVLQFPAGAPRYRLAEAERRVDVELLGDRVVAEELPPPLDDPLVRAVEVDPERIALLLEPGSEATSYVLHRPFRLVFDVHRAPEGEEEPPPFRPASPRAGVRTIVIDPGHGGSETGAVARSGVVEKDLTLLLARALERRLEQRLPVEVVLTRDEDADLPLTTRTAIANQNKADLFISLHLNSSRGSRAHGAETYFLSMQASDQQAAESAARENRGEGAGGGTDPLSDLQLILWDLAQSRYLSESQLLAKLIQEELNGALGLKDRGVKQAPFTVLMGAAMPAVLVELGFLSNPEEETRLQDPAHRAELVNAIVRAVARFRAQVEGGDTMVGGGALR